MRLPKWLRKTRLSIQLKRKAAILVRKLMSYIKQLLFPLYLFPIKLLTYSVYYSIVFFFRTVKKSTKLAFFSLIWPFRRKSNFAKTVFWLGIFLYFAFTELRFLNLTERYGGYGKFFCSEWLTTRKLQSSVVRVVGGLSEGSGFFISNNEVLTSFHVIADEPSPKVIFPDGSFETPNLITANKDADLALLYLEADHPDKLLSFTFPNLLRPNEPLLAVGYPLGTDIPGEATVSKGFFSSARQSREAYVDYLQTNITLVHGMSGGPLVDQCGEVVGINTISLAGLSLFVSSDSVRSLWSTFTDQDIAKIEVDSSASPEEAVRAFYTYLKARRMEDGFNLLSQKYLEKTNFQEWTSRFTDILDVQIIVSEPVAGSPDTAFVKFSTKNWVAGETEFHYYEGPWQTVFEDGVYKMLRSNIKEVYDPDWSWFYDFEE